MRYRIVKIKNGLWKLEWEDGSYSHHSTKHGAERMAFQLTSPFDFDECPKCGYALIKNHIGPMRECARCDFKGEITRVNICQKN